MTPPRPLPPGVEIVEPTDSLKRRAPVQGKRLSELAKEAEAVIRSQQTAYAGRLAADVEKLQQLRLRLMQAMDANILEDMRFIAHDMKGQGTTFGYPLITRICDTLANFLAAKPALDAKTLDIIAVHIDSLLLVVGNSLVGEHPDGKVLVANLTRLLGLVGASDSSRRPG
jgi:hypothetical protein